MKKDHEDTLPRVTATAAEIKAHKQPEPDNPATEAQHQLIRRLGGGRHEGLKYGSANELIGKLRKKIRG